MSPAAQAERKTQPSENWILRETCLAVGGSLLVSDSSQRRSCSALLKRAELVLDSMAQAVKDTRHSTSNSALHGVPFDPAILNPK